MPHTTRVRHPRNKQNMYEDGMCAPFIVCGPGVKAGQKLGIPIYIQDPMTSLAKANYPKAQKKSKNAH
jgi:hypothetical protein